MATTVAHPRWPEVVKVSLQPRLLRLPLLILTLVHALAVVVHLPRALTTSLADTLTLAFRPTLVLCSLLAFATGVLPLLIVRRRLLARTSWQNALVSPLPPSIDVAKLPSGATIAQSITARLRLPAVWISALLNGISAMLFSAPLLASIALYSSNPSAWTPYQQVPSTRRPTSSFRSPPGFTVYWRPNELVFVLLVQPLFVGMAASLASSLLACWPVLRLRVPVFPFYETIDAVHATSATGNGASGTLPHRVASTLPGRAIIAASRYAIISTILVLAYLPLRLPLFRLILTLLPPYSTLRRLAIPSLQPKYSLYSTSNILTLFGVAAALAALYGATQAVSASLWEIYATHPIGFAQSTNGMAVLPSAADKGQQNTRHNSSVEVLLEALEAYAPGSTARTTVTPAERRFLFEHALADLAILAQSPESADRRRRDFWKHFAPSSLSANQDGLGQSATVSAWERVSEVLLNVAQDTLDTSTMQTARASTANPAAASSDGRSSNVLVRSGQGQSSQPPSSAVVSPSMSSSVASPAAAQARQRPATANASQQQANSATTTTPSTTVWQRLVAPPTETASQSAPVAQPTATEQTKSASSPPQGAAQPSSFLALMSKAVIPSMLTSPSSDPASATSTSSSSSSARSAPPISQQETSLRLYLIFQIALLLLTLSLSEDEWGSVTLSDRKGLGLDAWLSVAQRAVEMLRGGEERGGTEDREVVAAETQRRIDIVKREFKL